MGLLQSRPDFPSLRPALYPTNSGSPSFANSALRASRKVPTPNVDSLSRAAVESLASSAHLKHLSVTDGAFISYSASRLPFLVTLALYHLVISFPVLSQLLSLSVTPSLRAVRIGAMFDPMTVPDEDWPEPYFPLELDLNLLQGLDMIQFDPKCSSLPSSSLFRACPTPILLSVSPNLKDSSVNLLDYLEPQYLH
ncbi:hypothetical protein JCM11641_004376 [Rhodosporidiobolus odoratus]